MHAAARTGQNLVVEWIFSVKPDYLDKIDEDGRSALLWASWNGHAEPVRAMCSRRCRKLLQRRRVAACCGVLSRSCYHLRTLPQFPLLTPPRRCLVSQDG